jgi:hypothetical protein
MFAGRMTPAMVMTHTAGSQYLADFDDRAGLAQP